LQHLTGTCQEYQTLPYVDAYYATGLIANSISDGNWKGLNVHELGKGFTEV